jgi:hypothetical protein
MKPFETTASEESGGKLLALEIGLGDNQMALQGRIKPQVSIGTGDEQGMNRSGTGREQALQARMHLCASSHPAQPSDHMVDSLTGRDPSRRGGGLPINSTGVLRMVYGAGERALRRGCAKPATFGSGRVAPRWSSAATPTGRSELLPAGVACSGGCRLL